jgi:molybdenum cofactor synthesis domain-containing protein
MRLIRTQEAIGHVLCHDITQIIKGVTKDVVFRKGHVVREEDIPVLLSVGKDTLYIWEKEAGMLHENEAAEVLYDLCKNDHMVPTAVKEGKIEVLAACDGLLKVDVERLRQVNALGEMMIATRRGNFPVKKGDKLAGTRVIPLVIKETKMKEAKELCGEVPLLELKPFAPKKVGIVTTGNEVFYGRIQDTFTPVLEKKVGEYQSEAMYHAVVNDDHEKITNSILEAVAQGAEMVLCSGGMSVDPDDKTPLAIKNTGATVVSYGAPVLPGAMFLIAYLEKDGKNIPIMGLPGCVMYEKRTIFDLILPRVMANDPVTPEHLSALGNGGLCLSCDICTFPNCGFGNGA